MGQITSITPTVGEEYLHAGLLAGAIGLILVGLYLLAYYRALGVVASASLVIAGIITFCLFVIFGRTLGFTLTLAGITGAIVAIGITADSFIVYFERIRDEVRDGKSLRVAAETGWIRARRTLLAADFVSLLGAVVLYILSIGSVRGLRVRPGPDHRHRRPGGLHLHPSGRRPARGHQVLPVGASAQRGRPRSDWASPIRLRASVTTAGRK